MSSVVLPVSNLSKNIHLPSSAGCTPSEAAQPKGREGPPLASSQQDFKESCAKGVPAKASASHPLPPPPSARDAVAGSPEAKMLPPSQVDAHLSPMAAGIVAGSKHALAAVKALIRGSGSSRSTLSWENCVGLSRHGVHDPLTSLGAARSELLDAVLDHAQSRFPQWMEQHPEANLGVTLSPLEDKGSAPQLSRAPSVTYRAASIEPGKNIGSRRISLAAASPGSTSPTSDIDLILDSSDPKYLRAWYECYIDSLCSVIHDFVREIVAQAAGSLDGIEQSSVLEPIWFMKTLLDTLRDPETGEYTVQQRSLLRSMLASLFDWNIYVPGALKAGDQPNEISAEAVGHSIKDFAHALFRMHQCEAAGDRQSKEYLSRFAAALKKSVTRQDASAASQVLARKMEASILNADPLSEKWALAIKKMQRQASAEVGLPTATSPRGHVRRRSLVHVMQEYKEPKNTAPIMSAQGRLHERSVLLATSLLELKKKLESGPLNPKGLSPQIQKLLNCLSLPEWEDSIWDVLTDTPIVPQGESSDGSWAHADEPGSKAEAHESLKKKVDLALAFALGMQQVCSPEALHSEAAVNEVVAALQQGRSLQPDAFSSLKAMLEQISFILEHEMAEHGQEADSGAALHTHAKYMQRIGFSIARLAQGIAQHAGADPSPGAALARESRPLAALYSRLEPSTAGAGEVPGEGIDLSDDQAKPLGPFSQWAVGALLGMYKEGASHQEMTAFLREMAGLSRPPSPDALAAPGRPHQWLEAQAIGPLSSVSDDRDVARAIKAAKSLQQKAALASRENPMTEADVVAAFAAAHDVETYDPIRWITDSAAALVTAFFADGPQLFPQWAKAMAKPWIGGEASPPVSPRR